jgi:hypothetical protein
MWLPWLLRAPYRLTGPHEVGLRDFQFLQPQSGDGNDIKLSPDTVRDLARLEAELSQRQGWCHGEVRGRQHP